MYVYRLIKCELTLIFETKINIIMIEYQMLLYSSNRKWATFFNNKKVKLFMTLTQIPKHNDNFQPSNIPSPK